MRDWYALRALFFILLLMLAVLGLVAVLLPAQAGAFLVPTPESSAEQFVASLQAHRYYGAWNQLSQPAKEVWSQEKLAETTRRLETTLAGIEDVHVLDSTIDGDRATAALYVQFADGQERQIQLPLVRENMLWKVNSFDALAALADQ